MTDSTTAPQPKPWIMGIAPYVPGRSSGDDGRKLVKLSANENPLGCSPAASAALAAAHDMSRYPDPGANALRDALGGLHNLEPEKIICGTGSTNCCTLPPGPLPVSVMRWCMCAMALRFTTSPPAAWAQRR